MPFDKILLLAQPCLGATEERHADEAAHIEFLIVIDYA
jgi:hypothetical protein